MKQSARYGVTYDVPATVRPILRPGVADAAREVIATYAKDGADMDHLLTTLGIEEPPCE